MLQEKNIPVSVDATKEEVLNILFRGHDEALLLTRSRSFGIPSMKRNTHASRRYASRGGPVSQATRGANRRSKPAKNFSGDRTGKNEVGTVEQIIESQRQNVNTAGSSNQELLKVQNQSDATAGNPIVAADARPQSVARTDNETRKQTRLDEATLPLTLTEPSRPILPLPHSKTSGRSDSMRTGRILARQPSEPYGADAGSVARVQTLANEGDGVQAAPGASQLSRLSQIGVDDDDSEIHAGAYPQTPPSRRASFVEYATPPLAEEAELGEPGTLLLVSLYLLLTNMLVAFTYR